MSKVALDKVVQSIFEDQGTADVLRALYKGPDWCGGVTTHSVLLTLADYLSDLESWLDPPFYRRACQVRPRACVCCRGVAMARLVLPEVDEAAGAARTGRDLG